MEFTLALEFTFSSQLTSWNFTITNPNFSREKKYTFFPSWLSRIAGFRNEDKNGQVN